MKLVRSLALAGAAAGITLGAVAMPAAAMATTPATSPTGTSAGICSECGWLTKPSDNFAYAVIIHFTNHTDQSIFIGPYQTEVKPGETREIANGSTFGVDIDSNFSYGSKESHHYSVRAKNPSIGTPWIDIAGSGERKLSEGEGFSHDFDGHHVDVNRGGDSSAANGYKHFNVDVRG